MDNTLKIRRKDGVSINLCQMKIKTGEVDPPVMKVKLDNGYAGCLIRKKEPGWLIYSPLAHETEDYTIYSHNDDFLVDCIVETPLGEKFDSIEKYPEDVRIVWSNHHGSLIKDIKNNKILMVLFTVFDAPCEKCRPRTDFMHEEFFKKEDLEDYIKEDILFFYGIKKDGYNKFIPIPKNDG